MTLKRSDSLEGDSEQINYTRASDTQFNQRMQYTFSPKTYLKL